MRPSQMERFHRDIKSHSLDGILIPVLSLSRIRGNDTCLRRSRPVTNSKYKVSSTRFVARQAYATSFMHDLEQKAHLAIPEGLLTWTEAQLPETSISLSSRS